MLRLLPVVLLALACRPAGSGEDSDCGLVPEIPQDGTDQNCDGSDAGPILDLGDADVRYDPTEVRGGAGRRVDWMRTTVGGPIDRLLVASHGWFGEYDPEGSDPFLEAVPLGSEGEQPLESAVARFHAQGGGETSADDFASGDVDDDGITDVVIGSFGASDDALELANAGRVWVWHGPHAGDQTAENGWYILGEAFSVLGRDVLVTDVDGDGADDLLAGCEEGDPEGTLPGRVRGFLGPLGPGVTLDDTDVELLPPQSQSGLGNAMAPLGDVDGDGYSDLAVGAHHFDYDAEDLVSGGVYIVPGPLEPGERLADDGASVWLGRNGSHAGQSVAAAGDLDDDGLGDVIVGGFIKNNSDEWPEQPTAWLLVGITAGTYALDEDSFVSITAEGPGAQLGSQVTSAGDFDADGYRDVAIAAPDAGDRTPGMVYFFRGPFDEGRRSAGSADLLLLGQSDGDGAGRGLAGGEDVDGDGYDDLLVGAPNHRGFSGVVYQVHGHAL